MKSSEIRPYVPIGAHPRFCVTAYMRYAGETVIAMLAIGSLYALVNLFHGSHYQCTKRAILHPEVQRRLMWDGKNNPYNVLPVTAARQAAFDNKNIKVKLKWYSGIAVNATWFIGSILYVMLVMA